MKTIVKKIIALTLVAIICCTMCCSCGIKEEEIVGTWSATYIFEENEYFVSLILFDDGQYDMTSYKNGSFLNFREGDWGIEGGNLFCYTETGSIEYDYKDGALVNGAQRLLKQ